MALAPQVAEQVPIRDAGGYFTSSNVEGALQELGAQGPGGLTNWSEASSTSAPNNTIGATSFSALSSLANADACLIPKGTGAILAVVPDSSSGGGNKRGVSSVDLQMARAAANQVASGAQSVLVGGQSNRATASNSAVIAGRENLASGVEAFVGGGGGSTTGNTASGLASGVVAGITNSASSAYAFVGGGQRNQAGSAATVALGGSDNQASGVNAIVSGEYALTNNVRNMRAHAHGRYAANRPAQRLELGLMALTTDATATVMVSGGGGVGTTLNQLVLQNDCSMSVEGIVTARQSSTGDCAMLTFTALIRRGANAASTTLVGSTVTALYSDAGAATWTVDLAADTTNGALRVRFTGEAAKTIDSCCIVRVAHAM